MPSSSPKKKESGRKKDRKKKIGIFSNLTQISVTRPNSHQLILIVLFFIEMSTSVINDSMVMTAGPEGPVNTISGQLEVDFAKCDCCGLTEECTLSYIETIRQRYGGKWICGLCAEAVKDEIVRCQKLISPDEAMARHFSFCNKFRASGPPQDPTVHLIRTMRRVLRKGLESPKSMRSMPCSPTSKRRELDFDGVVLGRSESCMPSLTLAKASIYCGLDEGCE